MPRFCEHLAKARSNGETHYDNGKPCKYGHNSKRFVSTMTCVECGKERGRRKNKGVKTHIHPFCEIWKAAKSCQTRREFKDRFPKFWMAAHKRRIMQSICSHMPAAKTAPKWMLCNVYKLARKYSTQGEFCRDYSGAADYAVNKGIWRLVTSHMDRLNSDYDAIYIWGYADNDDMVCKVGVTSQRLGEDRIKSVSCKSRLPCEFMIIARSNSALDAEKELQEIGAYEPMHDFNGSTEFRRMSLSELTKAYEVIYEHASA